MQTQAALGPVPTGQRLEVMDVLRGIALLGVFAMNIEWFNRPMQQMGSGIAPDAAGLDYAVAWGVHVFVAGKFWTMFSLLFGMGFVLMSGRIAAAGLSVERVFLRRMAALLLFGVLHIVLLWPGDILHTYAIAGAALMAMRAMAPKWQLLTGLALYAGIAALYLVFAAIMFMLPDTVLAEMSAPMAASAARAATVYPEGGFIAVLVQRVGDYAQMGLMGQTMLVPMVLGVFLVGSWLMSGGWLQAPAAHRRFWWRLLAFTLPAGLAFTAVAVSVGTTFPLGAMDPRAVLAQGLMLCGALPLSLAYVALVVLAWTSNAGARVLGVFAPVGRMALTHYLGQSLLCSLLFYGYGAGLFGAPGRAAQTGIVLGVFALQIVISHAWLSHHRYGPMEWTWRWLTYGRRPGWRRIPALP
ncbi:conserved membrane hypothetical protein [Luteimonas sp. 9C]|uniref:DUF418 domain-containing protein n=1 Tax=Luteimonas sp. 9C TaxID=2653148 RepID=UPI0012F1CF8C|nr:DUF418 domain-containing protein [Luteimonas sp. 9C]VXB81754.1 conserved membrane hypothetical protein [Luteimonas sp. 9C]